MSGSRKTVPSVRIIGAGRAGSALAGALGRVGWNTVGMLGRDDDVSDAAQGVDVLVIATRDSAVAPVARQVVPVESTVVVHLAGSLGLDVLDPHPRRGAMHPLLSIPSAQIGADRLLAGAWFAVAGDTAVIDMVSAMGGRWFEVADVDRATYHAAAVIASNHLVALLGQVERIARGIGVPLQAYLDLARMTVDNVAELGSHDALTGPVARGDWATVARHLAALDPSERGAYEAMAHAARRLAEDR